MSVSPTIRYWKALGQHEDDDGHRWWPISKMPESTLPDRLQGAMHGERSDGENFFIMMVIDADASMTEKARVVAETTEKLKTFVMCSCVKDHLCAQHKLMKD